MSANPSQKRVLLPATVLSPIPTNNSPPDVLQNADIERDNFAGVISQCLTSRYEPSSNWSRLSASLPSICFLSAIAPCVLSCGNIYIDHVFRQKYNLIAV